MAHIYWHSRPAIGVLAGWQFYRTATNLSYLKPVFNGINQAARDLKCNLFFGCGMGASASPEDPIRPAWPVPAPEVDYVPIGPENTDGLIVFNPLHSAARSRYIQGLIASGHPVLFIGSGEAGPTLVADNSGGIFEAVGHLVQHGHWRIAFLAGSPDDLQGDTGDRLSAYQSALASYGLECDPRMIAYGRHVYDGGYQATRQILDSGADFSALLASNDEMALGAMRALKEAGRAVPQDVALIGFDNRLEGAVHEPSLTSIHVPLFSMGYRAVELLLQHMEGRTVLAGKLKVNTRLVIRESCGCSPEKHPSEMGEHSNLALEGHAHQARLAQAISAAVLSQSQSLAEEECVSYSRRLVNAFLSSIERGDPVEFQSLLQEILKRTAAGEDDVDIWQAAISMIRKAWIHQAGPGSALLAGEILDEARQDISAQMQRQHRRYVAGQRWTSSRLSLLTTSLLTALAEDQIDKILAQHLPEMGIRRAMLVLFEPQGSDAFAWSTARNIIDIQQPPLRFPSRDFPPVGLFGHDEVFTLALIPLVAQSGQLGFAVFGTEFFDLYGAIVQQIGSALNTARLYRQAMEGRQLAEEANRLKSRFLSTVSHELRLPLNLILGLSDIVLKESEVSLPDPIRQDIERIHAYAQHLGGLINDVIDLATSDAGQLRLNNQWVDLGKTLRIVAESGRQITTDKGLAWEARVSESGPWVWGDPTRLRQVVLNLINNAIKFTEQGGIELRIEPGADEVLVSVHDTGLGISPDEQQVIFAEFRQSERSVSRGYGGLGLGLAICKRLVETMGGKIGVASSGEEGAGSTFYFSLPTGQPSTSDQDLIPKDQNMINGSELALTVAQQWALLPADADPHRPNRTILVVDDEPNVLELHARIVQSDSPANRVLKARNGKEALEILQKETVDLLLLDLQMPEIDGFTVLARMREMERAQRIPVIVVTGQALTEADMAQLSQGVTAVLGKGLFNMDETIAHINAALTRKHRLSSETQRLTRAAMAYLHEHFAEPITRRDLARYVGITEDYLTFCFRQELGATPVGYLQRYRVNQAKRLLMESQETITRIALEVGFTDSGYFSRIFRRETGLSPEAYRRS